jgi:hypothetical protein
MAGLNGRSFATEEAVPGGFSALRNDVFSSSHMVVSCNRRCIYAMK